MSIIKDFQCWVFDIDINTQYNFWLLYNYYFVYCNIIWDDNLEYRILIKLNCPYSIRVF